MSDEQASEQPEVVDETVEEQPQAQPVDVEDPAKAFGAELRADDNFPPEEPVEIDLREKCSNCNKQLQLQCHVKGMGQIFPVKADGHCSQWS